MTLRQVRFTNFDSETTTIFEKEFINRYCPKTVSEVKPSMAKAKSADDNKDEGEKEKK